MLKAKCKKCKKVFHGWALRDKKYRTCDCGGELVIENEEVKNDE